MHQSLSIRCARLTTFLATSSADSRDGDDVMVFEDALVADEPLYERDMLKLAGPSSLRVAPSAVPLLKLGVGATPVAALEKHGWALWVRSMGALAAGPETPPSAHAPRGGSAWTWLLDEF